MPSTAVPAEPATDYQPLARRYRPIRFSGPTGIVGQPHVVRTLSNAIQNGRMASAYLFAGPRGTGKTTTARVLAAALNCTARLDGVEPCGECESCQRIVAGRESADVIEIDAATNRSAEDARSLRQQTLYAPSTEYAHKVYILDEAHMLTREAWNALLKVLEEPPPRVHFVFCTTEPQKIQQTAPPILSRCQRLDMRRLTTADIAAQLRRVADSESIAIEDQALTLVARRADGGMRDALSMLDQLHAFQAGGTITVEVVREAFGIQPERVFLRAIEILVEGDRTSYFLMIRHLDLQGTDFVRFLADWQDALGALALVQEDGVPEDWSEAGIGALQKFAGREWRDGKWAPVREPSISTAVLVELMALCQVESERIRQAPRPVTPVLTLLQRSITLLHDRGAVRDDG